MIILGWNQPILKPTSRQVRSLSARGAWFWREKDRNASHHPSPMTYPTLHVALSMAIGVVSRLDLVCDAAAPPPRFVFTIPIDI